MDRLEVGGNGSSNSTPPRIAPSHPGGNGALGPKTDAQDDWGWLVGDWNRLWAAWRRWRVFLAMVRLLENLLARVVRLQINGRIEGKEDEDGFEALVAMIAEHARDRVRTAIKGLLALARERFVFWWEVNRSRVESIHRRIQVSQDRLGDLADRLEELGREVPAQGDPPPEPAPLPGSDPDPSLETRVQIRTAEERASNETWKAWQQRALAVLVVAGEAFAFWCIFADIWGTDNPIAVATTLGYTAVFVVTAEATISANSLFLRHMALLLLITLSGVTGLLRALFLGSGSGWLVMLVTQIGLILIVPVLALAAAYLLRNARRAQDEAASIRESIAPGRRRLMEEDRLRADRLRTSARRPVAAPGQQRTRLEAAQSQVLREYEAACAELEAMIHQAEAVIRGDLREVTRHVAGLLADNIVFGAAPKEVQP